MFSNHYTPILLKKVQTVKKSQGNKSFSGSNKIFWFIIIMLRFYQRNSNDGNHTHYGEQNRRQR